MNLFQPKKYQKIEEKMSKNWLSLDGNESSGKGLFINDVTAVGEGVKDSVTAVFKV